jgi:hypothetical protein
MPSKEFLHLPKNAQDEIARLHHANELLSVVLQRYMAAYPAFRIKPEGAPGSHARNEQERLIALENAAEEALFKRVQP